MNCIGCKFNYNGDERIPVVFECGHTCCFSCVKKKKDEWKCKQCDKVCLSATFNYALLDLVHDKNEYIVDLINVLRLKQLFPTVQVVNQNKDTKQNEPLIFIIIFMLVITCRMAFALFDAKQKEEAWKTAYYDKPDCVVNLKEFAPLIAQDIENMNLQNQQMNQHIVEFIAALGLSEHFVKESNVLKNKEEIEKYEHDKMEEERWRQFKGKIRVIK